MPYLDLLTVREHARIAVLPRDWNFGLLVRVSNFQSGQRKRLKRQFLHQQLKGASVLQQWQVGNAGSDLAHDGANFACQWNERF